MSNVTRSDIAKEIAEKFELSHNKADEIIRAFVDSVVSHTAQGEVVSIANFVKFEAKEQPARSYRNPATGEAIEKEATKRVSTTALKKFKDAVKGN